MNWISHSFIVLLLSVLAGCASTPNSEPESTLDTQLGAAHQAYQEGRLDEAERLLREVTAQHPTVAPAWFRLGNIYYRTGRYDAAVYAYDKTLLYDKNNHNAWHNLALTRVKQSVQILEDGLRVLPGDGPERQALVNLREKLLFRFSAN